MAKIKKIKAPKAPKAPKATLKHHLPSKITPSKITPSSQSRNVIVHFPVVGIGASAGGLEAVTQFLKYLPPDSGVAVVVIQHLDPKHESLTAEILGRATRMPVIEAQDRMALKINQVYVIPPNYDLGLRKGRLQLVPRKVTLGLHLPIDSFFNSLAEELQNHAMGVVLSGTGSDGTKGLLAIKAEGGVTFAQKPKSAKFAGMPESAIAAGAVDLVLSPEDIADEIARVANDPYIADTTSFSDTDHPSKKAELTLQEETLNRIFAILRQRVQVDLTNYKRSTIMRRLARRMLVSKSKDLSSYAHFLEKNPEEAKSLFADILIHVTNFFRDVEAFHALKKSTLPKIMKGRDLKVPFRVWVAGCSTGEEAYSLMILLLEYLEASDLHLQLQFFASDISESAIQKARAGFYGEAPRGVSKQRLEKYFEKVSGGYRVNKQVRDICVFSVHDITRDPPFAKVDLISCRNVLIYFDEQLQKRVIPLFHYSLNPGGILFLGKSENIGGFASLFSTVDKVHKIFLKKNVKTPIKLYLPTFRTPIEKRESGFSPFALNKQNQSAVQQELDRMALKVYAPPSILINDAMEILQVNGRTAPFLEMAPGQPSLNLFKMLRPELMADVRKLVQAVRAKGIPIKKEGFRLLEIHGIMTFNVLVTPLKYLEKSKERCYAIFFEVLPDQVRSKDKGSVGVQNKKGKKTTAKMVSHSMTKERHLLELQRLKADQEHLQALNEAFETGQEELTAANEELQSANEELQSTNEEMETAREELQSSNEELTTVNDELQTRNAEMTQIANDLTNLLESIDLPIALLGADGRIRRFTSQAEKQFKIIPADLGRKIADLRPDIGGINIEEIAFNVMQTGEQKEIETRDGAGNWYRLVVRPYRKADGKNDGAVVALMDINATKMALEAAKLAEKNLEIARADANKIIEANPVPLVIIKSDHKILLANRAFLKKFSPATNTSSATNNTGGMIKTEGLKLEELGEGQWNIPELTLVIKKTLNEGIEFQNFVIAHEFPGIGFKIVVLNARRIHLPGSGLQTAVIAFDDVTERRKAEESLKESEEKYRNLVTTAYDGIMVVRHDATIEFANRQLEIMFGYDVGELVNKNYEVLINERDRPQHANHYGNFHPVAREMGSGLNILGKCKDGTEIPIDISLSPFKLESVKFVNCVIRDISKFKEIEKERLEILGREKLARQQAELANRTKDEFLAMLSHELRTPLTTILTWSQLLRKGVLDPDKTKCGIENIEKSALAQGQLINDLLDISRIQAGKLKLSIQKINPDKVVMAAIDSTRSLAAMKSIQIETSFDPSVSQIFADPIRLQQILWNLITNAIKFSPQGGRVWVTLDRTEQPNGEYVRFQVRDNGKGIKPEFIPVIFDRFIQLDSTSTRSYGGLGLGLAIVKKLVEMHEGSVEVQSAGDGKGANFIVALPLKLAAKVTSEAEAEAEAEASLGGLRILLVDDDPVAREAFALTLQTFGANVKTVGSASEALAIFEEYEPDVLVSDIGMPLEDGYSLIKKVRALNSKYSHVPALALTAFAGQDDIQHCHLAGFQSHVAKPVDGKKLAMAIARLTGRK